MSECGYVPGLSRSEYPDRAGLLLEDADFGTGGRRRRDYKCQPQTLQSVAGVYESLWALTCYVRLQMLCLSISGRIAGHLHCSPLQELKLRKEAREALL